MHQTILISKLIVIDENDNVLLIRRSKTAPRRPYDWEFPGGIVEDLEDPKATAIRELQEECGINTKDAYYLFASTSTDLSSIGLFFFTRTSHQIPNLSYEHDKYEWVNINKANGWLSAEVYKKALKLYQDKVSADYEVCVSAKTLLFKDNYGLLLKRSYTDEQGANNWDLPGGQMNDDETVYGALLRELKEETGLTATDLRLTYAHTEINDVSKQLKIRLGILSATEQENILLSDEHSDYEWIKRGDIYSFSNHSNWPGWAEFVKIFG